MPRNEIEAVCWLEAAAEQKHVKALYLAGDAYSDGWHGERDPAWAARWYGRAASLGLARAQYKLALLHYGGLGIPRNLVQAHHWVSLASRAGAKGAAGLTARIEAGMSEEEKLRAEVLAVQWRAWPVPTESGDDMVIDDPPSVLFAQLALAALNFPPGAFDGRLDGGTRRALAQYRRARGLGDATTLTPRLLRRLRDERPRPKR